MRLFDKLASMGPAHIKEALRKGNSHPQAVLVVDEIARHYAEHDQLMWGSEDYPYARPPWQSAFVEWTVPPFVKTERGVVQQPGHFQHGSMVVFSDSENCVPATARFFRDQTGHAIKPNESAKCVVIINHFGFSEARVVDYGVVSFWFMREDGWIENVGHTGVGLQKLSDGAGPFEAQRFFDSLTHTLALAFTFANCSNVKLTDDTESLSPTPKICRRLRIPEVRRYTLNIAGHATSSRREASGEGAQGVMPFHLCRGHFATYTAEKPLFGRHVGRYWIPPHTKGKKANGEVEKDYAIR